MIERRAAAPVLTLSIFRLRTLAGASAAGLLSTSQQLGGAIGIGIASSVAASQRQILLHAGETPFTALRDGFWFAFWVLGAIAVISAGDLQARACDEAASRRRQIRWAYAGTRPRPGRLTCAGADIPDALPTGVAQAIRDG